MSLERTKAWFEEAIPEPKEKEIAVQLGCHFEEIGEMLTAMDMGEIAEVMEASAELFKSNHPVAQQIIKNLDREALLDSLIDQNVTSVGISHMMKFDHSGALEEVNRSNFSKFEDGKAVFDENGKITKGKDYVKPNLKPFV